MTNPPKSIFYLDDNLNNLNLMRRMLESEASCLRTFENFEDAYTAIQQAQPDLLFVDMHLKTHQTGLDLVVDLRREGFDFPIVLVTVFHMMADRQRALAAGCDDYLNKPYSHQELLSIIKKHL